VPPLHNEEEQRHQGEVVRDEPACPDQSGPGQDAMRIDPRCPQADITPLVPLSSPTPSETRTPTP
jgi:hypothetical protein